MKEFRILLIESYMVARFCIAKAVRDVTPEGVRCKIEHVVSVHQAIHLLLGYDMSSLPHLILVRNTVNELEINDLRDCSYCEEFVGFDLREIIKRMGLSCAVVQVQQSEPTQESTIVLNILSVHPVRCDLVAQIYQLHLRRTFNVPRKW